MSWFDPMAARVQAMAQNAMGRVRARRWQAYRDLFAPGGDITSAADIVLADLRNFCRARETTYEDDPRRHALLEGRREVWLRISNALNLSDADVAALDPNVNSLLEETNDE